MYKTMNMKKTAIIILLVSCVLSCGTGTPVKEYKHQSDLEIVSPALCDEKIDNTPTYCVWLRVSQHSPFALVLRAYTEALTTEGEKTEEALEIFFILEKSALSPDGTQQVFVEQIRNFNSEWRSSPRVRIGGKDESLNSLFRNTEGLYRIRFSSGDYPLSRVVISAESDLENISLSAEQISQ